MNKALVTYALLYANGSLHLGHMAGAVQSDIWVRQQRMLGREIHFVSGDDSHGTPIMLRAEEEGITPEALINAMLAEHKRDLAQFTVEFDHYHTTHSPENKTIVETIYNKIQAQGDIEKKTIQQAYDSEKNMFLPDRYVKGTCPSCKTEDQYGDSCEHCGATYSPSEMINAISTVSGTTPTQKESEHYFFKLSHYQDFLKKWTHAGHLQNEIANKLDEWLDSGLQDWDISRDAPYFGFAIPGAPDKFFYVWMDAPIGYLASFKSYCNANRNINYDEFLDPESDAELIHFIGKDIVYFHALFWPAILESAQLKTPTGVYAHSFLTINGKKMSKSRGTFIKANTFVKHLNPEQLRYYFAAKLSNKIEDIDLNFDEYLLRVNSELVGKYINIASRSAGFITKHFGGQLADGLHDEALYQTFVTEGDAIANDYHERNNSHAIRKIMALADLANQFIADAAPWKLIKEDGNRDKVQAICSLSLNLFRVLTIYLSPVLPETTKAVMELFNETTLNWYSINTPLLGSSIQKFKPLMQRVEQTEIDALLAQAEQEAAR
jgi:methionyl-tRNA synthetase